MMTIMMILELFKGKSQSLFPNADMKNRIWKTNEFK